MGYMFMSCSSLTTLDLSGWNVSNVFNMSQMFFSCKSLTTLDLSGWEMRSNVDLNSLFGNCYRLSKIKMIGCNDATINKIKEQLTAAGKNSVRIITE